MNEFEIIGGARIGPVNMTKPFVSLTVNADRLDLNASIVGNYSFTWDDILSIESYSFIGKGIKINHNVPDYKKHIVFWSSDNEDLIRKIRDTGFLDRNKSHIKQEIKDQVRERQKQGAFPMKPLAALSIIAICIFLSVFDLLPGKWPGIAYRKYHILALAFILTLSILLLMSKKIRAFILKEGRQKRDIDRFLYFMIIGCVFVFLVFFTTINEKDDTQIIKEMIEKSRDN
jgi:hypothetical protein